MCMPGAVMARLAPVQVRPRCRDASCRSTRCKRCTHASLARCAASPASRSISRRSHLRRPSGSELMRRRPPLSPRDLTVIASCDGVARSRAHTAISIFAPPRCTHTQPAHAPPTTRHAAPPTRDLCARSAAPSYTSARRTPRMVAAWPPQSPAAYRYATAHPVLYILHMPTRH